MVTDILENLPLYVGLSENFRKAISYILTNDLKKLPIGKTNIHDELIFASVSEYHTLTSEEAKWESHKVFADIQIVLEGEEKIGYAPITVMNAITKYDCTRDLIFYSGHGDYISMRPGNFAIFLPGDAHQPCVAAKLPMAVKKVVFKVMV